MYKHYFFISDTFRSPSRTNRNEGGTPFAPNTPQEIDIGMTVLITRNIGKLDKAIVRYIGTLPGQGNNVFVGLELSRPGNCNLSLCIFTC